jgi:hypothetical protein
MFQDQGDYPASRLRVDLVERAITRAAELTDYFDMASGSLRARRTAADTLRSSTDRLGVAVAITTMNSVMGTTDADWWKIPEGVTKTLDHEQRGTDGSRIVALEAKCTVTSNTEVKSSTVSKMKRHIQQKKSACRGTSGSEVPMFGTIALIPEAAGHGQARVLLLDPPAHWEFTHPRTARLRARLSYYAKAVQFFREFAFLRELRQRLRDLVQGKFDENAPLRTGHGNTRSYLEPRADKGELLVDDVLLRVVKNPFRDGAVSGVVLALHRKVLDALISQDSQRILELRFAQKELEVPVEAGLEKDTASPTQHVKVHLSTSGMGAAVVRGRNRVR